MKKGLDCLLRTPVYLAIKYSPQNLQHDLDLFERHLPEGYILSHGIIYFMAGYQEKYVIDGKEYSIDVNNSAEEQKKTISVDLIGAGFSDEEIQEILQEIPTVEGDRLTLGLGESSEWLEKNPKVDQELNESLKNAEVETKKEVDEARESKREGAKSNKR